MRLLLDTHTFLWATSAPHRLGPQRAAIEDARNERLLSAVSAWEIVVKYATGRLPLPEPPARFLPTRMRLLLVTPVPIDHAHAYGVGELPMHHRDPFDRLLIAQARALDVPIVTVDRAFLAYDVDVRLISSN